MKDDVHNDSLNEYEIWPGAFARLRAFVGISDKKYMITVNTSRTLSTNAVDGEITKNDYGR